MSNLVIQWMSNNINDKKINFHKNLHPTTSKKSWHSQIIEITVISYIPLLVSSSGADHELIEKNVGFDILHREP